MGKNETESDIHCEVIGDVCKHIGEGRGKCMFCTDATRHFIDLVKKLGIKKGEIKTDGSEDGNRFTVYTDNGWRRSIRSGRIS
ncbi:MAG: hypothetical protein UX91_C0005G0074 [Candidatus Amesbacteria bacterium GW2011_GWB1_47_19]|nr:MAG: hypothetical protein UW51_C0007G0074 [Candidatus Amesbacteria bacterium GW2011_GWA1_44_24]KKU31156.1 MAG: hypothetical protein UX46_C0007G0074 [Candidatus Amesbacteria bacterium GW2011_GWC1_46_24]KKU67277.1 MAG: hypothetical protein UX91_C0005G0074 [Candidatus Amesbacteria bacterium GW2011_GWB1_47_19]OGD05835.1 MAG: hypothetical protein A2379_01850 [Candidatus Amesbacteria bacterium RIFOXYB1_FULL_47_13]HBC72698.1 hypothetical protein [Candidatus Amesbacteria bacterium]